MAQLEEQMIGNDDPRSQRERIIRLAAEVFRGCSVVFDEDQPPSWLRFRIDAPHQWRLASSTRLSRPASRRRPVSGLCMSC